MRSVLVILIAFALLATTTGIADHCETHTDSWPEVDTGPSPAGRYYVDNDLCQMCMWSIWVYQESNGIPGLQRADEVVDDTCHASIRGDTIVF